MKILLSAYACEPDCGSEPGVGWNWAIELAKLGHDVWVITRSNNEDVIINKNIDNEIKRKITFVYQDLPKWASFWKKGRRGIHLYYLLWQFLIFPTAKRLHRTIKFDVAHHVTFVSARQPSFLGLLGIPFIFGPVAGGDRIPLSMRSCLGVKAQLYELIRDLKIWLVKFDPLMHLTFFTAKYIYVNTNETKKIIPFFYHPKVKIKLAIGIEDGLLKLVEKVKSYPINTFSETEYKFLYVGRLDPLKGINLAIEAFSKFCFDNRNSKLTIVGSGSEEEKLKRQSLELQIESKIDFIPQVSQEKLWDIYRCNDFFIFPSLRDSGGMVVLEAMSFNLPVVCFNLAGPGQIVDNSVGCKVDVNPESTEEEIVYELSSALSKVIAYNSTFRKKTFLTKQKEFLSSELIKNIVNDSYRC